MLIVVYVAHVDDDVILAGGTIAKLAKDNDVRIVYGGNGINGYHSAYMFEERKIVLGRVGVYCGAVHYTLPYSWVTDNALYVAEKDSCFLDEYLVLALGYANLNQYASQSGQPLISQSRLKDVELLVPPLPEQQHIAAILVLTVCFSIWVERRRSVTERHRPRRLRPFESHRIARFRDEWVETQP